MTTLNQEGYPTTRYLKWLSECKDYHQILEVLEDGMWTPDWCFHRKRPYAKKFEVAIHTAGWSGNEDIIHALKGNLYFWVHWTIHKTGGHYWFNFPIKKEEN